jgi:hypothetical protein
MCNENRDERREKGRETKNSRVNFFQAFFKAVNIGFRWWKRANNQILWQLQYYGAILSHFG